jgi:hypothetical protein
MIRTRVGVLLLLAALCLLTPEMLVGAGEDKAAADAEKLQAVVGSDAAAWALSGSGYSFTTVKGRPALLTAAGGHATLTGTSRQGTPAEYRLAFRLHPQPQASAGLSVMVGIAELPDKTRQACIASVSAAAGAQTLNYSCSIQPATDKGISGVLGLQAVAARSLAWPEEMRATIEAQIAAAPKLDDTLCTLRLVATPRKYAAWLNGRFIGQFAVRKGLDPSGTISISLDSGAELVSLRVGSFQEAAAGFEPLDLGGFVNASVLADGQAVATGPVDQADQPAELDGVPFRFPAVDEKGDDHLDLAPSWMRFGALAGYFDARSGTFGGRWTGANRIDPSRFCMYVPYGQYKALHLIAAYDGRPDTVPTVTAQFYRPDAGAPMSFSAEVPLYSGKSRHAKAFPVKLADGRKANLFHVVIPIDPDKMAWFSDLPRVGLELTKAVQPYRGYPDPLEYSVHAAGLPSGVHIYAATLEEAAVAVDPQPDAPSHIWTAPAQPSYTIALRNNTGQPTTAKLTVKFTSYDGKESEKALTRSVSLNAGDEITTVKVPLHPTRFGLHYLTVACKVDGETATYTRNFAYLHPDTRERGDWAKGRGPILGYWSLGGGHDTPDAITELLVMSQAGAETSLNNFRRATKEVRDLATKLKFTSRQAFDMGAIYTDSFSFDEAKYDRKNPEATKKYLIEELGKMKVEKGPLNVPEYLAFFPEPQLGRLSSGIFPRHYNAPEYVYTKEEEALFKDRLAVFLLGARAVKEKWPDTKILLPYGDPMYTAQFLELSPEARELIDGTALDLPLFERLPEQQMGQVVLNRLYPILQDIKKYKPDPYLVMVEGPAVSSADADTTFAQHANLCTRNMLALFGYGVYNHESANEPFDCADYWGENHYGGGLCTRLPKAMPKIAYVSSATMTRHLNRCNFVKYVPTGSTSVYCQQYKHYKTGKLVYVLWTIRGERPVTVKGPEGSVVEVYGVNDNPTALKNKNGGVTFTVAQAPVYLEGMTGEVEITLGESDHSDAAPAENRAKLGNLGDGSWTLLAQHDEQYEKTNPLQIERFLGNMSAQTVKAPKAQGRKALAVHLGEQAIDRKVMPYYTSFVPKEPVVIPGKASHLGLWVHAASDWGRVVYSLRDAKGERWLSVGSREEWNSDDIRCWSAFCFDGWRYLRFELPANAPYDSYRELGSTNWGSYEGDGIVDLPLKLDKIIVERHSSVIYGNDLVPAKPDDVLLGDLYAEYASEKDSTKEAIRLSALRMPIPAGEPALDNPIAALEKAGVGAPTQVLKVTDPDHQYDGTRCHVHFTPVAGAKSYDVWVSPYADGRGAMQLAKGWTESGKLIEGLRADTDFYVFVVYTAADGKMSKPSQPLKIRLKNKFVYR